MPLTVPFLSPTYALTDPRRGTLSASLATGEEGGQDARVDQREQCGRCRTGLGFSRVGAFIPGWRWKETWIGEVQCINASLGDRTRVLLVHWTAYEVVLLKHQDISCNVDSSISTSRLGMLSKRCESQHAWAVERWVGGDRLGVQCSAVPDGG